MHPRLMNFLTNFLNNLVKTIYFILNSGIVFCSDISVTSMNMKTKTIAIRLQKRKRC